MPLRTASSSVEDEPPDAQRQRFSAQARWAEEQLTAVGEAQTWERHPGLMVHTQPLSYTCGIIAAGTRNKAEGHR